MRFFFKFGNKENCTCSWITFTLAPYWNTKMLLVFNFLLFAHWGPAIQLPNRCKQGLILFYKCPVLDWLISSLILSINYPIYLLLLGFSFFPFCIAFFTSFSVAWCIVGWPDLDVLLYMFSCSSFSSSRFLLSFICCACHP